MLSALSGDWKLVYTSNSELLAVLALGKLPFVTVGDITQRVDAAAGTVENRVQLSAPLSRTALSTTAAFEVRSPKRIALRFERGAIATPELLSDIEVPETLSVLGQTVDLAPLRGVLQPAGAALSGLLGAVDGVVRQLPPDVSFPLPGARSGGGGGGAGSTWLLTTYLDDDLRITRGDGGSVFVLTRVRPSPRCCSKVVLRSHPPALTRTPNRSSLPPDIAHTCPFHPPSLSLSLSLLSCPVHRRSLCRTRAPSSSRRPRAAVSPTATAGAALPARRRRGMFDN